MSAHTDAKAVRLLAEGRLRPDGDAEVFVVDGDHGSYFVVVGAHVAICTCPATGECSHLVAAKRYIWATPDERELVRRAAALRREMDRQTADAIFKRL